MSDAHDDTRPTTTSDRSGTDDPDAICDRARDAAREGAEVMVGLAILGFQSLQVRRREFERSMGITAGTPLIESIRRIAASMAQR